MKLPSKQIGTGPLFRGYQLAGSALIPLVALALLAAKRGRVRYGERFGEWGALPETPWWFHGASIGEVQGIIPILQRVRKHYAQDQILLTATSPTGLERGAPYANLTRLIPIDSAPLVRRALAKVRAKQLIISETELWPVFLSQVLLSGLPVSVVNGRVSDYTLRWYRAARSIFGPIIASFSTICVPDAEQRNRYIELGAVPDRVHVTGHTKYDTIPALQGTESRDKTRERFFTAITPQSRILVLGSIRAGEEHWWFEACQRMWQAKMDLRVIIAPRHAERFEYFIQGAQKLGVACEQWSKRSDREQVEAKVLILDLMGKLEEAYSIADLAFVGATLVDIGGHNPCEPAMYGVPVCVGPYTSVIREVVNEMRAQHGIIELSSKRDVCDLVERLCSEASSSLQGVGLAGQQVWERHRGSADRVLTLIGKAED